MKAYQICCADEDHGQVVVFLPNPKQFRKRDTRDCDCPFLDVCVRRAPTFDDLTPGPVTVEQYLDRGWFYGCVCCGRVLGRGHKVAVVGHHVYCNADCVAADRESWRGKDGDTAHESVRELCRALDEWLAEAEHERTT